MLVVFHVESDSGPQRSLAPRLSRLAELGAQITCAFPAGGRASRRAAGLGAVLTNGPSPLMFPSGVVQAIRLPVTAPAQARTTRSLVRATGADLVIVSSPTLLGALPGARREGARTLLYCGEILARGGVRGGAGAVLARLALRHADGVVAPSRAAAEPYRRAGAKVTIVEPPIDSAPEPAVLERLGADFRARFGIGPSERLVCSLGAITAGRGQDLLIEAQRRSRDSSVPWRLIVGGEAYDRPRDREFAERLRAMIDETGADAQLAGYVEDPHALYAAANVFVNPARIPEGFGRAACEALAASCPVVSTDVGGVRETLRDGETALLVPPGSSAVLGDAVARLLRRPELSARLAEAGRRDVMERFAPAASHAAFLAAAERAMRPR